MIDSLELEAKAFCHMVWQGVDRFSTFMQEQGPNMWTTEIDRTLFLAIQEISRASFNIALAVETDNRTRLRLTQAMFEYEIAIANHPHNQPKKDEGL